ncbi:mucin-associated surface protein [Arthrobacter humicola]|uniref:mucin-associated surface protein n=1 Tax=Arthrobacter humicola TaxID=409291 RepID=UPI001FAC70B3|nr:mucin-associated surface protein [Arthrobacter humicola]
MSDSRTAGQDRGGVRYRVSASLLAGLLAAGTLAGCGSPAPELGSAAARQLQSEVLAVSEAAAANDPEGSLKHLDELLTRLDAVAASGEVSFRRHQSIKSSIDAVRADLTAQQAAEAARKAAEKAAADKAAADKAAAEQAAAAQAAAQVAAARTAPAAVAPAPAPAGKGKSKDKGKGKG